jgi:signal transduction histidine kinase
LFCFQKKIVDNTFDSIYKKVIYYSSKKQNTNALIYAKRLLKNAINDKHIEHEAKAYYKIADSQRRLNFKDSAYYFYNKSKQLYLDLNDSIQLGKSLFQLSIIESDFGNFSNSDSTAVQTLKYLKGRKTNIIGAIYNCLAINSKKRYLYKDAISYYETALKFSKSKNSKIIYNSNIANVFKEQTNYSKAIEILEDLLKDSISNQKTKGRIIANLAHIRWLKNSKENVVKDLLLSESIAKKETDNYGLMTSYAHLSDYYKKANKKSSLLYAKKFYQFSKKENSVRGQIEAIEKIVALQTPQKAVKYYKESIRLRDIIKEEETKRQYKFSKIKYNYEEEEKQKSKFEKLAAKNLLIAEQEHSQKKSVLIFGIILTSGLFFYIYRRKQQHKKRILQESYNTETRIAKKLHDELGNDIFNTLTKIQNPNIKTEEIVNDLDKIYLQTRAISHENDSIEIGINFENYFRGLVSSYNSDSCKIILKDLSSLELNNLSKDKQIVLYRVFNELFVNMKKHSKASLVVLSCKKINNDVEIIYVDNGIGFKENTIVFKNGLKNMVTRLKMINGTINFENKQDRGLKATIHFKK